MTQTDLINLRRTIYLTIMSSMDFEEGGHKLMKIPLAPGQEMEIVTMILECCSQEKTYIRCAPRPAPALGAWRRPLAVLGAVSTAQRSLTASRLGYCLGPCNVLSLLREPQGWLMLGGFSGGSCWEGLMGGSCRVAAGTTASWRSASAR